MFEIVLKFSKIMTIIAAVGKITKIGHIDINMSYHYFCRDVAANMEKINLNQSSPSPEYFGYIRSGHDPALLVSPLVVAGIVIGLVLFLSCVTIIIGSLRKDGGERDWRLENPSYDGISYATSSFGDLRSVCTGDISPALDFGSYLELSASYPDYPPW
ncbi:unnamed protein product [Ranitomeya imitator]|uniref:Uncharacterized protein n=1 Tax=Ranitomeya imitator TaxID=111125 RepID=A0ABN9M3C8_9NEOB|nr:unnamed protein product [Ranitomeya imitator]